MGLPDPRDPLPDESAASLEASVDGAIAACGGDAKAAVRALIVAAGAREAELRSLHRDVDTLTEIVSRGYARGRVPARGGRRGEA